MKAGSGTLVLTGDNSRFRRHDDQYRHAADRQWRRDGQCPGQYHEQRLEWCSTRTGTGTYAGVMSGSGSMNLLGPGSTLTLSGTNTYSGRTTVNAGTLAVNGSLASVVTVQRRQLAAGAPIDGIVSNGGIDGARQLDRHAHVSGNYIQNRRPDLPGRGQCRRQSDRVNISGTATINGGTVTVVAPAGTYARSTTYTILTATGGVTGTYSGRHQQLRLPDAVALLRRQQRLPDAADSSAFAAGGGETGNQIAVGGALDQINDAATGRLRHRR